jgi:hypothetical protein
MIQRLVAFGDSWTYGDELIQPNRPDIQLASDPKNNDYRLRHCFAGQVARHYGWQLENLGTCGQSLQSMIWCFESWLDQNANGYNDALIVVGLTHSSRISWWDADPSPRTGLHRHSTVLEATPATSIWHNIQRNWRTYSACDDLYRKQYQTAVYLFSGHCARLNIPCVMLNVFGDVPDIPHNPVDNPGQDLMGMVVDPGKGPPKSNETWAQNHPNSNGHSIIAQWIIQHIDSKQL